MLLRIVYWRSFFTVLIELYIFMRSTFLAKAHKHTPTLNSFRCTLICYSVKDFSSCPQLKQKKNKNKHEGERSTSVWCVVFTCTCALVCVIVFFLYFEILSSNRGKNLYLVFDCFWNSLVMRTRNQAKWINLCHIIWGKLDSSTHLTKKFLIHFHRISYYISFVSFFWLSFLCILISVELFVFNVVFIIAFRLFFFSSECVCMNACVYVPIYVTLLHIFHEF